MSMDNDRLVDVITDKVIEHIENLIFINPGSQDNAANFIDKRPTRGNPQESRSSNFNRRFQGRRPTPQNKQALKFRSCQSSEHLFRSCPTWFCQAYGNRGHDAWDASCLNYQWLAVPQKPLSHHSEDLPTAILNFKFEGIPTNALLDIGASCSLIDIGTLRNLSLDNKIMKSQHEIVNALGNKMNILGSVDKEVSLQNKVNSQN